MTDFLFTKISLHIACMYVLQRIRLSPKVQHHSVDMGNVHCVSDTQSLLGELISSTLTMPLPLLSSRLPILKVHSDVETFYMFVFIRLVHKRGGEHRLIHSLLNLTTGTLLAFPF